MSTADTHDQNHLGGRLPLLSNHELSEDQLSLQRQIFASRVATAVQSEYLAALPDGRLIGPFNAMMHAPGIAEAMLSWAHAISVSLDSAAIEPVVRETVILTVAACRHSRYALYAHTRAARHAGLSEEAVNSLTDNRPPNDLPPSATVAHRLARALTESAAVDDVTYAEAVNTFGVKQVVALVSLLGQYLATCAILACFDVPAPTAP